MGRNPLFISISEKNITIVSYLLENRASPWSNGYYQLKNFISNEDYDI